MVAKQSSQTDNQRGKGKQQEANLGQKEAREEKEKKSELSSMGEDSHDSSDLSQKRN
jgi:hypothetical protein